MPTEQTLTAQRGDPAFGSGSGASRASRGRLDQTAALLAPVALVVGLALAGGGFGVSARHIAGLGAWLAVVGLLVLGVASRTALARPFYWVAGLIGGLAFLSAISSFWSGSIELSVIEADRVLVYLGFFLAAFLIAQTAERRQGFAEGLAIAVALVALLGLTSRLLPHVLEVSNALGSGPRLRYPLGYWNANGAACGIGVALLLWMSRHSAWRWLRWASVAALPAVLLTLYFTYSRGGLLALAVGVVCLLALSRDRLWLLGTLAAAGIGVVPAILAVQDRYSLANNVADQAAVDQGVTVLLVLLAGIALTLIAFAGLRVLEGRNGKVTGRALAVSRNPQVLRGIAVTAAVAAIGLVVVAGGHRDHRKEQGEPLVKEGDAEDGGRDPQHVDQEEPRRRARPDGERGEEGGEGRPPRAQEQQTAPSERGERAQDQGRARPPGQEPGPAQHFLGHGVPTLSSLHPTPPRRA